jgi:hypothetical protein
MHDANGEQLGPSAGVRSAQMICAEWPFCVALGTTEIDRPNAREIPLGAFLGASDFAVEILSFKIIWLAAQFDARKRTTHSADPGFSGMWRD